MDVRLIIVLLLGCSSPTYLVEVVTCPDAAPDVAIDAPPDAPPQPAKVGILLAGQSNAEGRALCTNVTIATGACGTYDYSELYDEDTDSPLDPFSWQIDRGPVSLSPRTGNNFGVEMPIGTILHSLGKSATIGFAKAAVGSTRLADHWFAHCYASVNGAADVGCSYVNPTTGTSSPYPTGGPSLPDRMFTQAAKLEADGYAISVIVWIQGEADASYAKFGQLYTNYPNLPHYGHYDENLSAWFGMLHAQWPNATIVFARLNSAIVLNYTHDVEVQQDHVAATLP